MMFVILCTYYSVMSKFVLSILLKNTDFNEQLVITHASYSLPVHVLPPLKKTRFCHQIVNADCPCHLPAP